MSVCAPGVCLGRLESTASESRTEVIGGCEPLGVGARNHIRPWQE